jgi:hypothetical protein
MGEVEGWATPCDDAALLLQETAAWDTASDEDLLRIEKVPADME